VNAFFRDLKSAVRALLVRPAFSALVIGVLGCGLACVIFTLALLNGFILRPLPFPAPEQLLQAGIYADEGGDFLGPARANDLLGVRRQVGDLAQVGGFARSTMKLSDVELPERDYGALRAYRIDVIDPATLSAVAVLLGAIGFVACWVAARRAANVDPIRALRDE
jgi:ABC-type antimicrobial peptide transport system permease subunit